jgi:hypothetical protein
MSDTSRDFDVVALYDALDEKRVARGLSWPQLAREIGGPFRISPSTLRDMRSRRVVEGDGVLQMLRWLNRTPESFVPGAKGESAAGAGLPVLPARQVLRFDTRKLHAAIDAQRAERGQTWAQVASEIGGIRASSLMRLSNGGRTAFPDVMRMVRWLGRPAALFTRASSR